MDLCLPSDSKVRAIKMYRDKKTGQLYLLILLKRPEKTETVREWVKDFKAQFHTVVGECDIIETTSQAERLSALADQSLVTVEMLENEAIVNSVAAEMAQVTAQD
jgi:hypothetical protein